MISLIYKVDQQDNQVSVEAVVEDMVLLYSQTHTDPEEYGPALCSVTFELEEGEQLPINEDELIDYLNDMNLDWEVIPKEDI